MSLAFLKICIKNIKDLWPNAKLKVVPSYFSQNSKSIYILQDQGIFSIFKVQNKQFGVKNRTLEGGLAKDKTEGKNLSELLQTHFDFCEHLKVSLNRD